MATLAATALGPLIIDVAGTELTPVERKRLSHPLVGGVVLFSRNYRDRAQLKQLIQDIHQLRKPRLLVTVDHEGGRIQRWLDGFTRIPAMGTLGQLYDKHPALALERAYACGLVSAAELTELGVDLNFAPVLDVDYGRSIVLRGGRSFHADSHKIVTLAREYIKGLQAGGMQAVGKHFPGHGGTVIDSHFALPTDPRSFKELAPDIFPFQQLIQERLLGGVMSAHILYSQVHAHIATLSAFWLRQVLRQQLGFSGTLFSDCISMQALDCIGDYAQRFRLALRAGCDLVLLCNQPQAVDEVLADIQAWPEATTHVTKLYAKPVKQIPNLDSARQLISYL